jgi:hypothetical protein
MGPEAIRQVRGWSEKTSRQNKEPQKTKCPYGSEFALKAVKALF